MSRRRSASEINLGELIARLSPVNNRWREGDPDAKVLAIWDMGDELLKTVDDPKDNLLWEIQDRSYMTRNMLRYALIVRRGWGSRSELKRLVKGLRSYTLFREALPFLKGDRQGVDTSTYDRVASLLAARDSRAAIEELRSLKRRVIGRKHRKGTAMEEAKDDAARFLAAYAAVVQAARDGTQLREPLGDEALVLLSQGSMAAALGNADERLVPPLSRWEDVSPDLIQPLCAALAGGRSTVSAFKKVVGPERLIAAADLFNSLRSAEGVEAWRARRGQSMAV